MQTVTTIKELRQTLEMLRSAGKKIGFVPTMGNLHRGHLSLIEKAQQHADVIVVSVFVNPMQFGPNEDFDQYPRTLNADSDKLQQTNTDILFTPSTHEIYPHGMKVQTNVEVPILSNELCGASRPGFFRGICTILNKFFNIVQPDCVILGEKDYQQLIIVQQMVADLSMPIKVIGAATVRESNQLALSSRNQYLSDTDKRRATLLFMSLCEIKNKILTGKHDYVELCEHAWVKLAAEGFKPDYFSVRQQENLQPATAEDKNLIVLGAAYLGKTRLIDNIKFTIPGR